MEAQTQAMVPPQGPPYVSPKGMWVSKLLLRCIGLLFCVIIFGLAGAMMSTNVVSIVVVVLAVPPVGLAFCWSLAEGICILARGGHRGIHPGANVGMDLIIWLALLACELVMWAIGMATSLSSVLDYPLSYNYRNGRGNSEVLELASGILQKGQAIIALQAMLIILHFTLFVIACYETNVRNRLHRPTYVVYQQPVGQYPASQFPAGQQPVFMTQGGQPVYYQVAPPGSHQSQQPMYYMAPPSQPSPLSTASSPVQSPPANPQGSPPVASPPPVYTNGRQSQQQYVPKQELPAS